MVVGIHRMGMSAPGASPDPVVHLVASLEEVWKEAVEDLLYFNPRQADLKNRILESIQLYGAPRVEAVGGRTRITLDGRVEPGAFFALVGRTPDEIVLAGLVLYLRRAAGLICLYLSVSEEYTAHGLYACRGVAFRLLNAVQQVGMRIHGVDHIEIYNRDCWHKIPLTRSLL